MAVLSSSGVIIMNNNQHLQITSFSDIPEMNRTWQKILPQGNRIERPKGYELLSAGNKWETLYYLESGEMHLMRTLPDGRERLLWVCTPPSFIGEGPFFDEIPTASYFIVSKPSVLYGFSHNWVLNTLLPKYPELTLTLLQSMASKLRVLHNQSICLTMEELPSRICKYLYVKLNHKMQNNKNFVTTGLNQQELANLLGVHRVTLNKVLRTLEKQGILGPYSKHETYILDMDAFLALIEL